jgi:hypothetical protein
VRMVGSVEINRPQTRSGPTWATTQRHQLASQCPPAAPITARPGPGRRHHPRGTAAAGTELPHRRQHRPGRGRTPAHLVCPRSAEAAAGISDGGADRPGAPAASPRWWRSVCSVCCDPWSRWWRGCSNGRPPPTSDAANTCWRRHPSAGPHRRKRRPEIGPLMSADDPSTPATTSVAATLESQVLIVSKPAPDLRQHRRS